MAAVGAKATEPVYYTMPDELRRWFAMHHASAAELYVGFYKKGSVGQGITWSESVDEALCVGWIDGVRRTLDESHYTIRFTPRRKGSIWSAVNIRKVEALTREGRMRPAGLAAFALRREERSKIYTYEQRGEGWVEPYVGLLQANPAAWKFFQAQPPSYRKKAGWWVAGAKREETRLKRLAELVAASAGGRRLF